MCKCNTPLFNVNSTYPQNFIGRELKVHIKWDVVFSITGGVGGGYVRKGALTYMWRDVLNLVFFPPHYSSFFFLMEQASVLYILHKNLFSLS